LRRQWAVLRGHDSRPHGWQCMNVCNGYVLVAHPEASVRCVECPDGRFILVGVVVDTSHPCSDAAVRLRGTSPHDVRNLVEVLRDWTGTYVLLACFSSEAWLYTDAASLETVYYGGGRAASSPLLLPGLRRDDDLDRQFRLSGVDDWYPGSLCPFVGTRALHANHRLELGSGRLERFWPDHDPPPVSRPDAVDRIGQLLRVAVVGLHRQSPVLASLTGGKDTRLCLAASKDLIDGIEFFTIRAPCVRTCDLAIAGALADRFGLNHRFIDDEPAPGWLLSLYDEMSAGMSVGARRDIVGACRQLASDKYVHLNGNLGAMAKRFFWPSKDPQSVSMTSMARWFANNAPCVEQGLEEWFSTVPDLAPATVYNLMYLEQRGGRWEGVGENASKLFYGSMSPFCNRRVFELISGVPPPEQGHPLLVDIVRSLWPELLEIPYCRPPRRWTRVIPKGLRARLRRLRVN
jgi:hypothetical protein